MGTMGTLEFICLLWVAMGLRVLTITSYDENQGLLMQHAEHHSTSAVLAWLGLKALDLAWLEVALAFPNTRPSQSHQPGLGSGLAWPRLRLLYVKYSICRLLIDIQSC